MARITMTTEEGKTITVDPAQIPGDAVVLLTMRDGSCHHMTWAELVARTEHLRHPESLN